MTGWKSRALRVHPVVPYKALGNFSKALCGTTRGTCNLYTIFPFCHGVESSSVCNQQSWTITQQESDLLIISMITDRIGWHKVLVPINHKNFNLQAKRRIAKSWNERKEKFALKDWQRRYVSFKVALKLRLGDLNYNFECD